MGRLEVEEQWSFEDACVAHDTIEMLDAAEHEAAENARRRAERKSSRRG